MLQSRKLSLAGLGVSSARGIGPGIHLRWSFATALGFANYGFDLYRRNHVEWNPRCVPVSSLSLAQPDSFRYGPIVVASSSNLTIVPSFGPNSAPAIVVGARARIVVRSRRPMREFTISEVHSSDEVTVEAYDGSVLVASAIQRHKGTAETVTVRADRFTRVVITAPARTGFYQMCWLLITDGAEAAGHTWQQLEHFELPPDWATASSRIPGALHPRYAADYPQLDRIIHQSGDSEYHDSSAVPEAKFTVKRTETLLLASLDPGIGRMLGLYHIDATAVLGTQYDYKVEGSWAGPGTADHTWICWGLERDTPARVPRPKDLKVDQMEVGGGFMQAGGVSPTAQTAASLTWDVSRSPQGQLSGNAPIFYHIYRQIREDGRWSRPDLLTADKPVLLSASQSDGSLPSSYYVDGPLAPGEYRYRIRGIDVFGRRSAYSRAARKTISDTVAPPAPTNVRARLSQNDGTIEVVANWEWPETRRAQAGDASGFRIYHQTEHLDPVSSTITAVTDLGGTSVVDTELDPAGDYSRFEDGVLINGGRRFSVTAITVSGSVTITVENVTDKDGNTASPTPVSATSTARNYLSFVRDSWKVAGQFLLETNWSNPDRWDASYETEAVTSEDAYSKELTSVAISVSRTIPVGYAYIGVGTVDDSGNVGPVSSPARVAARHLTAPDTPEFGGSENEYATRADFYGESRYTLTFSAESEVYYDVYRATDAAVLAKAGSSDRSLDVDDDALLDYANDSDNDGAFVRVDARDENGSPLTDSDGDGEISYTDTMVGTARNRYLYKVQSYDQAGNRSGFSDAQLVHLYDVTPPNTPVITKIQGGESRITVTWAVSPSEDLVGYELYRTEDTDNAHDYRLMELIRDDEANDYTEEVPETLPESYEFDDSTVVARTPYYYALVAVKETADGVLLRSKRSIARTGQAYDLTRPDPPEIDEANSGWVYVDDNDDIFELNEDTSAAVNPELAIRIVWTEGDDTLSFRLSKKRSDEYAWDTLGGWSPGDEYAAGYRQLIDTDTNDGLDYDYKIHSRSAAGLVSTDANETSIESS